MFNGFESQEQLDEITEMVLNAVETNPFDYEYKSAKDSFNPTIVYAFGVYRIEVDLIEIKFTVENEETNFTIKLWDDHNLTVETNATLIESDIIDAIATLREMLINGDFDEYYNND